MELESLLKINTSSLYNQPLAEVSPTPSLDSTGSETLKYLEEVGPEDDVSSVIAKNTHCLICNYVFHSEADFVNHGRVHFGNAFQKGAEAMEAVQPVRPPAYSPVTPTYHHQTSSSFNWSPFICNVCHIPFNSYDILMCHFKLYHCQQQFTYSSAPPVGHSWVMPFYPQENRPSCAKGAEGRKCSCAGCGRNKASAAESKPAKRKRVEKENLDVATLNKMREMEWERRKGYWCTKCNVRFGSQMDLVDHMSSKEHLRASSGPPDS